MEYEWDESKQAANKRKHQLGFELAGHLNWSRAVVVDRTRRDDGEARFAGIGMINERLHTVVFTWRAGSMRIISLRRANKAEEKLYAQAT